MFDATDTRAAIPLPQSREFARAARHLNLPLRQLNLAEAGSALIQRRRWAGLTLGLMSRGPLWSGAPDLTALRRALRAQRHPMILNPDGLSNADMQALGCLELLTPATIARLDLTGTDDDRHAAMHQKWRNRLTAAQYAPLRITRSPLPDDPHHWLLSAEATQRRTRGYQGWPAELTLAFAKSNPHMAQIFTAFLKSSPVAAMLFLRHGSMATYHIGHTTEAGRALNAHNLILADAADWLARRGHTSLDLGTIDTHRAPGLARFKLGSGAKPHTLGGTWLYLRPLAPLARHL